MRKNLRHCTTFVLSQILGLTLIATAQPRGTQVAAPASAPAIVYPGLTWQDANSGSLGWSTAKLEQARQMWLDLPPSSVFVVHHGYLVAEWGDPALHIKLSSMRKSFLSTLYGIYLQEGKLNLNKTLNDLAIEDDPQLNPTEKQATVKMLLQARSGVYHSYLGGTPATLANMPPRGSHAPGTFWYYNNWDFNALGAIFEQETQTKIGIAFRDKLATPLQLQDFRLEDMYYLRPSFNTQPGAQSLHPAYNFRLTARDMARIGYLYLRSGNWNGKQIVPAEWVKESTTAYSQPAPGEGYGYLWWVDGLGLPVKSYSAQGALAKYIVVIPERDLVVVYQNHTELPDKAPSISESDTNKLPTISTAQFSSLLKLILAAQK